MQVYRGLGIGTAKPSPAERERVPHHLIDICDLSQSFDAAQFVRLANDAVSAIHARGKVAILCGGTGLYFKAFFHGLGNAPPTDPALRSAVEKLSQSELLDELAKADFATFEKIDRQNRRRLVRAVEVIRLTGRPFSNQRADWNSQGTGGGAPAAFFGISRSPDDLRARIDARVDEMLRRGLVEETQRLVKAGLAANRTAMQALGYKQVVEFLQDARSLPETVELVKIRTRQFAKRQMTWFRKYLSVQWHQLEPDSRNSLAAPEAAHSMLKKLS